MVNTFLELGIDQIAGNAQAFLNLTANFFLSKHYEVLPSKNVVLEVLESIEPTPSVLKALIQARHDGYQIALDDFVLRESHRALMDHADYVKVDVLALTNEELREQVAMFQDYPVRLLAEKVEDQGMYDQCLALGFEYFQGYFFASPRFWKVSVFQVIVWRLCCSLQNCKILKLKFMNLKISSKMMLP